MKCIRLLPLLMVMIVACSSYERVVKPIKIPEEQKNYATIVDGATVYAEAFVTDKACVDTFGFNIRKAGLLPVLVTIKNDSPHSLYIDTTQTFLYDGGNYWRLLSMTEVRYRLEKATDLGEIAKHTAKPAFVSSVAGALIGATVAIVTGRNVGEFAGKGAAAGAALGILTGGAYGYASLEGKITEDLSREMFNKRVINPGTIAWGILYFPGKEQEAQSARSLRIRFVVDNTQNITVNVPVLVK